MSLHQAGWLSGALFAWLAIAAPQEPAAPAPSPVAPKPEPRVGVRFEGFLPGTRDETLAGQFTVEFKLYLSPQGGDPVWSETQRVSVEHGRMDVTLGMTTPISMALHESTFKFLGASVGGAREVYPRFTIVNTVYASLEEALRTPTPDAAKSPAYAGSRAKVSAQSESPCTWKEALLTARAAGRDLSDYRDWYAALAKCGKDELALRCGHYEWVLPWVYDTASHGEYNRLFRGRFQGCDYMDLAPTNKYVCRFAELPPAEPKASPSKTR